MTKSTALLVIDVQQELFEKSTPVYMADTLLDNINALVARAHRAGVPVIYVQHSSRAFLLTGSEGWQLHSRLKPLKKDLVIQKTHPSAFEGTALEEELQARKVRRLVVTGMVTHGCVKATCIDAQHRGYEVLLVQDGHSNFHKQAEKVIAEWNEKLGNGIATMRPARAIRF